MMGKGGGHDTRGRRENTTKRGELFLGMERDITPQGLLSRRRGVMHDDLTRWSNLKRGSSDRESIPATAKGSCNVRETWFLIKSPVLDLRRA